MQNFTLVDMLGTIKACLAMLPFLFAPGYVAGWALNLFEFRQRRPILRLILSIPLSIAICPMLSYVLGRFLQPGLWAFYIGVTIGWVLLLAQENPPRETVVSFKKDLSQICLRCPGPGDSVGSRGAGVVGRSAGRESTLSAGRCP